MSLNLPSAPYLEFQAYFPSDRPLSEFAGELGKRGGQLAGIARVHRGVGRLPSEWSSIHELPLTDVSIDSVEDLARIEADPHERLVQVYMNDVTGLGLRSVEIVTLVSLPDDAISNCNHPVAIWTDGSSLDGPRDERRDIHTWGGNLGRRAREFFVRLVRLGPAYAVVTTSERMPCPSSLLKQPSYVFRDFFLSDQLMGDSRVGQLVAEFAAAGAEVSPLAGGSLVLGSGFMNKRKQHPAPSVLEELSGRLGREIGRSIG